MRFHETIMGKRFFDRHMPQLVTTLSNLQTTIAESTQLLVDAISDLTIVVAERYPVPDHDEEVDEQIAAFFKDPE